MTEFSLLLEHILSFVGIVDSYNTVFKLYRNLQTDDYQLIQMHIKRIITIFKAITTDT